VPILYPLARTALFQLPPETAHELVTEALARLPAPARTLLRLRAETPEASLRTRVWGIDFPNPVGLAAGFDKSATAFNGIAAMGFGFVEIGTLTALEQPGNPRPRVFRLPEDRALLNRMGFNNPGAAAAAAKLEKSPIETVLGINIGKSRATPLERAVDDYLRSIELLERFADYLVINVSSPNTPGLRELQEAGPLRELLAAVLGRPPRADRPAPPVLLKLAPDLTDAQLEQVVDIAVEAGVDGIVAVNTTTSRERLSTPAADVRKLGDGGISGAPLRERAQAAVSRIYSHTGGRVPIIGVGGIFTAEDAWQLIRAGSSLVQVYTGFVYEGPEIVRRINRGLADRLRAAGHATIADVVGAAHR
jgi:dihydroorotate dehydrogenase